MLVVEHISKSFRVPRRRKSKVVADCRERAGLFHAVGPVSFRAAPGQILGVLGENGAGKTTLLRLLSTALSPSSGGARFGELDLVADATAFRRRLGFLSGTTGVYGRLTPREMIAYYGQLHGLRGAALRRRTSAVIDDLGMQAYADRRCDALSTGMKQRVSIARTLVHDPEVLVLDEPTTGLDVAAARTILELTERCREQGKTILLSTHRMHEVERLCDRVVVLRSGKLVFEGSVAALRRRARTESIEDAFLAVALSEVTHAA